MPDPSVYPVIIPSLIVIFGACVGSFLNVCIHRIPLGESILFPGSHCPKCHSLIPFYLNLPVLSYVILRGRCSACSTPISVRYPLVEAVTGGLALGIFYRYGLTLSWLFWFCFAATLVVVTFIDMDHQIIPDRISLPGIILFSSSWLILPAMTLKQTALGILVGGGIPWALAMTYYLVRGQQGLGGGDIKLLAMIGAATGVQGVLFTLFMGSVAGTIFGLSISMPAQSADAFQKKGQIKIPFGPFLSLGALIYVLFGKKILFWYAHTLLH